MAGIGVTASLFKEKQREGRLNVAYLAYQDIEVSRAYTVYLKGKSRQEQEVELATYINDLATNYRLDNWDIFAWYCPNTYTDVYSGKTPFKLSRQGIHPHQAVEPSIIFSSSCNPFHHGHGAMVQYCRQKHSKSMVFCELSIKNFEKPTVDYISLHKRLESIPPIFDDVIVSSLPDFVSKSVYYPNCYFAVGVDTINRIDWLKDRDRFEQNKVKFLVFPRAGHDMKDKRMLYDPLILFAYDFEPLAVSSTEIRAANK
jgi:nicotinic acid mononucleotide adenylyltransferase